MFPTVHGVVSQGGKGTPPDPGGDPAPSHNASAWTNSSGSWQNRGFRFRVNGDCQVKTLRLHNNASQQVTATVQLWDVATETLLTSAVIVAEGASGWNESAITPVGLSNGSEYIISAFWGAGSSQATFATAASDITEVDPHVIFISRVSGYDDSFPTTVSTTENFAAGFGLAEGGATGAPAFKYIRLLITANNGDARTGIGELQLFDRPAGQNYALDQLRALAADVQDGSFVVGNAFDGDTVSTSWRSNTSALPHWIRVQLPGDRSVATYKVTNWTTAASAAARAPKDWTLQGSHDGSSWETIHQVAGETGWSQAETRTYSV